MRTVVVAGGTDGIGRALATEYVGRGDVVVVIGRDAAKAPSGARFVEADLSSVRQTREVTARLLGEHPAIDALVFCARHYRSERTLTAEGIEANLALFTLSRFVMAEGLRPALERAPRAVVVNVAGPGAPIDVVRWSDLELADGYHGGRALGQGGKLNDLLGVAWAARGLGPRYVLVHPGVTATSFAGEYDEETLPRIARMQASAQPVSAALPPIVAAIDDPPPEPLSAFVEGRRLDVTGPDFADDAAQRLAALLSSRLAAVS